MLENLTGSTGLLIGMLGAGSFCFTRSMVNWYRQADSKLKLQTLVDNLAIGVYRSSLEGKLIKANPAMVALNGFSDHEQGLAAMHDIGSRWYVDKNRRREFRKILDEEGRVDGFVSEVLRYKTGERIWVSESARLVCDRLGRPLYYEGTVREYTDTMRKLQLEDSYRKYADNVPGVLFQFRWDSEGRFTVPFASRGFAELTGVDLRDVHKDAKGLFKLIHPDHFQDFQNQAKASIEQGAQWDQQFRIVKRNKQEAWVDLKATPELEDDGSCLWHGFLMDITKEKNTESRIHNLAYYDALTGLPNRRRLLDQLKLAIDQSGRAKQLGAVLFVDVDDFKVINDTRGHAAGDQLLVETARRLQSCVGDEGIVARFAGDEFVILLTDLSSNELKARSLAERVGQSIGKAMSQHVELEGSRIKTSCSIGIAMFDKASSLAYEVLRRADMAMHSAKEDGKGRINFYCSDRQTVRTDTVSMMSELRDAIDNGELELKYQMQVNAEGTVTGAEGLLRWYHPTKGLISPDQFIPRAEHTGVIIPVTTWIFEEAFKTLARWKKDKYLCALKLSINISARQFHEPDFVSQIKGLVRKYKIDPKLLMLEMTEHVLTKDPRRVAKVMAELREIGVRFSLDDFGTGYSSLVHMRDLPFDEVKIDGKFIRDIDRSESDRAIVRSIIAMANALNLTTVAEWVETEKQQRFLKREGCDVLQGYLFGPAVEQAELEKAVRKSERRRSALPAMKYYEKSAMAASA